MFSVSVFADEQETFTSGDYEYALLKDGTAEITKYTGEAKELEVPGELDGHVVTNFGDNAYEFCSLRSITIPDSIETMGSNPFVGDDISISVSSDHPYLAVIDGVLFSKTDERLIYFPITKENYLTLTVTRDSYAAEYCEENGLNYTYPDANDWLNS